MNNTRNPRRSSTIIQLKASTSKNHHHFPFLFCKPHTKLQKPFYSKSIRWHTVCTKSSENHIGTVHGVQFQFRLRKFCGGHMQRKPRCFIFDFFFIHSISAWLRGFVASYILFSQSNGIAAHPKALNFLLIQSHA